MIQSKLRCIRDMHWHREYEFRILIKGLLLFRSLQSSNVRVMKVSIYVTCLKPLEIQAITQKGAIRKGHRETRSELSSVTALKLLWSSFLERAELQTVCEEQHCNSSS